MALWWYLLLLIITALIIKYFIQNRRIYWLSWQLPGPMPLPIIGNGLTFLCKAEDIYDAAVTVMSKYPSPMRFWFGPKFTIFITDVEQASKILGSTNFIMKDEIYKFLQVFNGEGLISGSGPKWKRDRKLMSPLFVKNVVEGYFPSVLRHVNILVEKLEPKINGPAFNSETFLHKCTADFVNESILGFKSDAQSGNTLDAFLKWVDRSYELVHARIVKVWLQVEWLFRITYHYKVQEESKAFVHNYFRDNINSVVEKRLDPKYEKNSMLDMILDILEAEPTFATEMQLVHHVSTLYTASEDTVSTLSSFALLLLGMYPEIQEKIVTEMAEILDDPSREPNSIEMEDISKMDYLDMCVKDVLRLFPIAPFLMRVSGQDFDLGKWTIPKGTSVVVSIHHIHRDPQLWDNPNDFHPEHFLPEKVKARHFYAYLPFSAGPRGCLGKSYAYMALKVIIVGVLRKYILSAEGKFADIRLKTDISVRTRDRQYPIQIKLRNNNNKLI